MRVGYSGTREGMSWWQIRELETYLRTHDVEELHHGDCLGGDYEAGAIAQRLGIRVVIHPPSNGVYRAYAPGDYYYPCAAYVVRNKRIVDSTDILVAAPLCDPEQVGDGYRGGTLSTIRYAMSRGGRVRILARIQPGFMGGEVRDDS